MKLDWRLVKLDWGLVKVDWGLVKSGSRIGEIGLWIVNMRIRDW